MTSRISCCNRALFRRCLRRTAPLWVVYLAFWIIALPLQLLIGFSRADFQTAELQYAILSAAQMSASFVSFLYGAAAAWLVFHWLFRARSAYFYAALPLRRETVFLTDYAAGLAIGLVPNVLIALLAFAATSALGSPMASACLQWLGSGCLSFFFFYSFAVLCCMVIGHIAAMPILYLVLNFTVYLLDSIVRGLLVTFVYGMPENISVLAQKFSPLIYLMESGVGPHGVYVYDAASAAYNTVSYTFQGWSYLLALAGVGLLFAVCSFFLYRTREMERSGDVVAVRALQPVFLYLLSFGCAFVIGDGIMYLLGNQTMTANFIPVMVCLLAGAFLGYAAAQMMLQKTVRVFSHGWWGYLAVSLCLLLAFGAARLDVFGYSRYVPETADIAYVSITSGPSEQAGSVTDAGVIGEMTELHAWLIDNRGELEQELRTLSQNAYENGYRQDFYLTYTLKNGRTVSRKYTAAVCAETQSDPESALSRLSALYNSGPAVLARNTPDWDVQPENFTYCSINGPTDESGTTFDTIYLNGADAYSFYENCLVPDLRDSSLGSASFRVDAGKQTSDWSPVTITLDLTDAFGGTVSYNYTVSRDAAKTAAYLESLGFCPFPSA